MDESEPAEGRAFVLHDSELVVDLIRLALRHGRFVVRAAGTLSAAERLIHDWRPELAILDMSHPDSEPVLTKVAENGAHGAPTVILGLVQRGNVATTLKAFELGATDIVSGPFSPDELLARAVAGSRRATGRPQPLVPTVSVGAVELDIVRRDVRSASTVVHLTGLEQSLVYLLASRAGDVVTRAEICQAVWGDGVESRGVIVDRHIRSLRATLEDDPRAPRLITTIPGVGYRLEAGPFANG
ncbi:MAG TPA: response regulator transcription factor [Candidatus Limnocylindrales bacterium]|nr:response regulator transcription factor [Candidatus Limnocylindrales bacterium]